jgi:hypothetical protein
MVRDKVLFYQHDLAPETMTVDKATLTWNLALGYMLSYDLGYGGGLDNPWMELVGAFQRYVLARYASQAMTSFIGLEDSVTQTSFETFTVVANWDEIRPYDAGQHTLPPLGTVVTSTDGTLTAGIFTRYNGVPLSAGDHYVIEERGPTDIVVRQPLGPDTSLTVRLLPGWNSDDPIGARAREETGRIIGSVPLTVTARGITFVYQRWIGEQPVAYYEVTLCTVFLPLILKGY